MSLTSWSIHTIEVEARQLVTDPLEYILLRRDEILLAYKLLDIG